MYVWLEVMKCAKLSALTKLSQNFPWKAGLRCYPQSTVMRLEKEADLEQLARNLIWQILLDQGVCIARFDDGDTFCNMIHWDSWLHEMMRLIELR